MMITETDLRELLHDMADEAPEQCTAMVAPGRSSRRFLLPVSAAAAVVLIVAGVVTVATNVGSAARRSQVPAAASAPGVPPGGSSVGSSVAAPTWAPAPQLGPAPTVRPDAKQRRVLTDIARQDGKINGDGDPAVYAVWTTFHRAYTLRPLPFNLGPELKEARQFHLASANAGVWIIWLHGHFGEGNTVMVDLLNAQEMKFGMASFDVDSGYGVDPHSELAPLGTVVRLT